MGKSKLPGMSIPFPKGAQPPRFCPRCLESPQKRECTWCAVPEGVRQMYQDRGFRALAECSGCMFLLVEVEEADA